MSRLLTLLQAMSDENWHDDSSAKLSQKLDWPTRNKIDVGMDEVGLAKLIAKWSWIGQNARGFGISTQEIEVEGCLHNIQATDVLLDEALNPKSMILARLNSMKAMAPGSLELGQSSGSNFICNFLEILPTIQCNSFWPLIGLAFLTIKYLIH